jgi:hypothetical protein
MLLVVIRNHQRNGKQGSGYKIYSGSYFTTVLLFQSESLAALYFSQNKNDLFITIDLCYFEFLGNY